MFGYVSGFFQMKQKGLDLDHLLWRKDVACLNFLFFSTQHQLLNLDFLFLKKIPTISCGLGKRKNIVSWYEKLTKSPAPPSALFLSPQGRGITTTNATLGSLALRCCGGPECTPSPGCGAGYSHRCSGRWAGRLATEMPDPRAVLWLRIVSCCSGLGLPLPASARGNHPWRGEHALRSARPWPRFHSHRNWLQSTNVVEGETHNESFF